jgi:hypothetical protein
LVTHKSGTVSDMHSHVPKGETDACSEFRAYLATVSQSVPPVFIDVVSNLKARYLWNARATVAHALFSCTLKMLPCLYGMRQRRELPDCENMDTELDSSVIERERAATVVPEWCLAQFYFK